VQKNRRFEIYLQAFRVTDRSRFLEEAEAVYNDLPPKKVRKGGKPKSKPPWTELAPMFEGFLASGSFVYVGRSVKGGYWRYWSTKKSVLAKTADGYKTQTVVGIMQALVGKGVVEHRGVVLWRAAKGEVVTAFDQCRLELFFGAMVFKPSRPTRRPPGTDQVLNWAAYGLWEESKKEEKHLLSEEEELDKKKLQLEYQRKYDSKPVNKKRVRENSAKPATKAKRRETYAKDKEKRDAKDSTTGAAALRAFLGTPGLPF
jgi:hypothetical protein